MEAGEATRPPDEAETPPTPLDCRGAVTPLLDRRTRDLFNRGATRHATAGFPSARGNLNIEEHNPPLTTAPPPRLDRRHTSALRSGLEEFFFLWN